MIVVYYEILHWYELNCRIEVKYKINIKFAISIFTFTLFDTSVKIFLNNLMEVKIICVLRIA